MALGEALGSLLDIVGVATWRIAVATLSGVAVGLACYHLLGKDPAAAAVAFGMGVAGFFTGAVWEIAVRRRR
ncbi:hypothetical protein GCM10027188_29120 [Lysobacter humi (ex Lee et al. 2017)]